MNSKLSEFMEGIHPSESLGPRLSQQGAMISPEGQHSSEARGTDHISSLTEVPWLICLFVINLDALVMQFSRNPVMQSSRAPSVDTGIHYTTWTFSNNLNTQIWLDSIWVPTLDRLLLLVQPRPVSPVPWYPSAGRGSTSCECTHKSPRHIWPGNRRQ